MSAGGSDGVPTGEPSTRQARARSTGRPSARTSPASSSTERPGRSTRVSTSSSVIGTAPRISTVMRASTMSSRGDVCSSSPVSSADGGPACWWRGSHGPLVRSVAR